MKQSPDSFSLPAKNLRARAERLLRTTRRDIARLPLDDVQKLVQELQVHQIELEMQNEELRRTQLELEQARDRYANLYDFAPSAHLTLSACGEILEANISAGRLFGLERGRLIYQRFSRFLPAAAQDKFYLLCQRVLNSDTPRSAELEVVTAHASRLVVQADLVRDSAKRSKQCRVSLTDITQLKKSERSLRESEARLQGIMDNSPTLIFLKDPQGRYLHANRKAAEMLHLPPEQLVGKRDGELFPPAEAAMFRASDRRVLRSGLPMENEVVYSVEGSPRTYSVTKFPLYDSAGGIYGIGGIAADITERKRSEESLRQSEQNLTEFFDHAPIGLEWLSASATILRANQAQMDLLGYRPKEYLGRFFGDFCTDPAAARHLLEQLAANNTVGNLRVALRRKDGAVRLVLVDAQPIWHKDEFLYASVFSRDITDRVDLEREILDISEREHRRIAHDLHDGLGQSLVGTAFLANSLRQNLAAKSFPEARQMDLLLRTLDQAITQTRSLARGLHPVRPEPNALMVALKALAARTRSLFHIQCRFICRQPVMVEDSTAATHLYRIAQEAVTNAIKHGKPDRVEIALSRTPERLNLTISDNGVGLSARPRKHPGLGLRIMRYRAGAIGGSLAIQKADGGGTTIVCSVHESAGRSFPEREQGTKKG